MTRLTGGGLLVVLGLGILTVVGALDWLGSHQATISAGVGTLAKVVVCAVVLSGIAVLAMLALKPGGPVVKDDQGPQPPRSREPIRMRSEQVPLRRAPEQPALPPGGDVHIHITGDVEPEKVAEIVALADRRRSR